jgi:DNA (cytosine-5)-methyltransferase 1
MFSAIDLFAGCGGLSEGLRQSGFKVAAAVEINKDAARTYAANHPDTKLFVEDVRELATNEFRKLLGKQTLHLLAGCPPCQGFSTIRSLNRGTHVVVAHDVKTIFS